MASVDPFQDAETSMRALLDREGLPQPDEIEYREASLALLWHETRLVVVIDVSDHPAFEDDVRPKPA